MLAEMTTLAAPLAPAIAAADSDHLAYRSDIQGLRAIAVLAVLVFHAFPRYLPGGFVGVDVFFVISGFLITGGIRKSIERGTFTVGDFYARRVRRIFPALLVVLVACLAFGWQTMLAEDLTQLAKHVFGGATFSSNLVLWQEAGYFDKASEAKPLLHLWSLGIEEQFYILWPALMWLAWKQRVSPMVLIAVTALASFVLNVNGVRTSPTATFYSPLSRSWELLLGAALAYRAPAAGPGQRNAMSIVGVALILFACWRLTAASRFPGWWALLPSVGAFLLIAAGPAAWANRVLLSGRLMVGIGVISFPLYLWHWPLLVLGGEAVPAGDLGRAGLLLGAAVLAWATYQFVEQPIRLGRARGKVFALCAAMLVVAGAAAAIYKGAGYPSRYPEVIQTATQYDLAGYRAGIRARTCFLDDDQKAPTFAAECVAAGNKPLAVLWGDSGVASLYPGLEKVDSPFRLAQFTTSGCPPILSYESWRDATCADKNRKVRELIAELKPEVVVLGAIWLNYSNDIPPIADTVRELHRMGVPRVLLLGPIPAWKDVPSRIVFRLWKDDPLHRLPPPSLDQRTYGLYEDEKTPRSQRITATLRKAAADSGAEFVSLWDAMCAGTACVTRAANKSGDSFYLDSVHLNGKGAEFLAEALAPKLSALPKP